MAPSEKLPMSDDAKGQSLLVTISENPEFLHGVRFITQFFEQACKHSYTLFYVAPPTHSPRHGPHGTLMGESHMEEEVKQAYLQKAEASFDKARDLLITAGCEHSCIDSRTKFQEASRIVEIMNEAEEGGHDAIVLGHRVRTWLDDALEGRAPTGQEIIKKELPLPVWVCEPLDEGRKNVLVCVDGAEPSFRMTAHVAESIVHEKHSMTLLRVKRPNPAGPSDPQVIFDRCFEMLKDMGFPMDRVQTKVVESDNVGQAILDEAKSGGYAVVASGRSGAGKEHSGFFFSGSVAMKLFKRLKGASLWVCC